MDRNFYLWSKLALGIGCVEMKKLRDYLMESGQINLDDKGDISLLNKNTSQNLKIIDSIIKSPYIEKKTRTKYQSRPYSQDYMREAIGQMNRRNIGFVTIDDDLYPADLRQVYDPPYILFYLGDIEILRDADLMAVVGSRKASDYGKAATKKIVSGLASKGIIIVSGMATGVDSYAHIYCMEMGTPTVAVLGTPIDQVYPKKNRKLRDEIIEKGGLILSEYNYDSVTRPSNFAYRNRIISGMSKGVLVCEAQKKSGTMITVETALQEGRNVYSVPGSIFSSLSQGCNKLIIDGAKPICDSEDILVDFPGLSDSIAGGKLNKKVDPNMQKIEENEKNIGKKYKNTSKTCCVCDNIMTDGVKIDLNSNKEDPIIDLLRLNGAMDLDHIQDMTGYDVATIISILNKLYLIGQVVELGNNVYALTDNN